MFIHWYAIFSFQADCAGNPLQSTLIGKSQSSIFNLWSLSLDRYIYKAVPHNFSLMARSALLRPTSLTNGALNKYCAWSLVGFHDVWGNLTSSCLDLFWVPFMPSIEHWFPPCRFCVRSPNSPEMSFDTFCLVLYTL